MSASDTPKCMHVDGNCVRPDELDDCKQHGCQIDMENEMNCMGARITELEDELTAANTMLTTLGRAIKHGDPIDIADTWLAIERLQKVTTL